MLKNYIKQKETDNTGISWQTLYHADVTLALPFQVTLDEGQGVLICEKIIRLVPFRRLVVFAKWRGQEVVAKLFFNPKKAKDTCFRDSRGVKALMAANIATPKLLYKGTALHQPLFYVMILERLPDVKTVADFWHGRLDTQTVFPLMRAVTLEIAAHHVLGILQRDIHLKNFLVNDDGLYSIDGSKITKYEKSVSKQLSIKYFALFLVQLGVGTMELRLRLFSIYAASRGWVNHERDVKQLKKDMRVQGQDLLKRYAKKIFRDCSLFKKIKTPTSFIMYNRDYKSPDFMAFLKNPDGAFAAPNAEILKAGRSATVVKVIIDHRTWVVKRYNLKNIAHKIRRAIRKSRGAESWRFAQQLYTQGIPTPKPIALIDKRIVGLSGKSYFVMEYVEGVTLENYFSNYSSADAQFLEMAQRIVTLFFDLKEMQITHGDLKMTNILIKGRMPLLIDFDGMCHHRLKRSLQKAFHRDLNRFLENWETHPSVHQVFEQLIKEKISDEGTQE